jgi:hypothetical protein
MKELYIAPEAKLLSFAAAENLANGSVSFDDLLGGMGTTVVSNGDDVDLGLNTVTLN